uniref:Uncharacterized protein n=1 Tax=Knipowitschia caucasica TaxID=637954 RepID=A0AAV2J4D4_KNICA
MEERGDRGDGGERRQRRWRREGIEERGDTGERRWRREEMEERGVNNFTYFPLSLPGLSGGSWVQELSQPCDYCEAVRPVGGPESRGGPLQPRPLSRGPAAIKQVSVG